MPVANPLRPDSDSDSDSEAGMSSEPHASLPHQPPTRVEGTDPAGVSPGCPVPTTNETCTPAVAFAPHAKIPGPATTARPTGAFAAHNVARFVPSRLPPTKAHPTGSPLSTEVKAGFKPPRRCEKRQREHREPHAQGGSGDGDGDGATSSVISSSDSNRGDACGGCDSHMPRTTAARGITRKVTASVERSVRALGTPREKAAPPA
jgi:hypothetical protein